jgi:hypothetical protein
MTAKWPALALAQGLACSLSTGPPLQKAEQEAGDACEGIMKAQGGFHPGCSRSAAQPHSSEKQATAAIHKTADRSAPRAGK